MAREFVVLCPALDAVNDLVFVPQRGLEQFRVVADETERLFKLELAVDKRVELFAALCAAEDQSLHFGQVLSRAPACNVKRHVCERLFDLLRGCPPRSSVLPVTHGFGLDAVERVVVREDGQQNDEQHNHHADRDQRRYRLRHGAISSF